MDICARCNMWLHNGTFPRAVMNTKSSTIPLIIKIGIWNMVYFVLAIYAIWPQNKSKYAVQDVPFLGLKLLIYVIRGQLSGQSYRFSPILIKYHGIPSIGRSVLELMFMNFEMGYEKTILDKETLRFVSIMVLVCAWNGHHK